MAAANRTWNTHGEKRKSIREPSDWFWPRTEVASLTVPAGTKPPLSLSLFLSFSFASIRYKREIPVRSFEAEVEGPRACKRKKKIRRKERTIFRRYDDCRRPNCCVSTREFRAEWSSFTRWEWIFCDDGNFQFFSLGLLDCGISRAFLVAKNRRRLLAGSRPV